MQKERIFELMHKNPGFFLATVDEGFPRVRGMFLYKADETGIVFHTGSMKDVYCQIVKNANVELCFLDVVQNIQIRVSGTLEIVEDRNLKDEISNHPSRIFLQDWRSSGSLEDFYSTFIVLRMKDGKAKVWTMETNFAPKEEIALY